MLNRSASLAMSTSVLKALPGKLDIKRLSPSILYLSNPFTKSMLLYADFLCDIYELDPTLIVAYPRHFKGYALSIGASGQSPGF